MRIVEIFDSIDGEGIRTGKAVSFVRTAGCNLRCSYCDTLYALFGEEEPCNYEDMSVDEVMSRINPRFRRVTLTGGEPLLDPDMPALTNRLLEEGFEINIETNGAVSITDFLKRVKPGNLFFTIDYKLPSSGMTDKMLWSNFLSLRECDVIKLVVGSDADFDELVRVVSEMSVHYKTMPHIYIGVVYGSYDPARLVEKMMNTEVLTDAVYQIQLHKYIWNPDARGV